MTQPLPSRHFGVYIHVPVCSGKCPYCDFASVPCDDLPPGGLQRIVDATVRNLCLALEEEPGLAGRSLESIYFGGGTPSLLPADSVARLICALRERFAACEEAEITLECNPGSIPPERLEDFRAAGINRVSLGVQSFDADMLRRLGRRHSPDEAHAMIGKIASMDFLSWGFDLIFGGPGASMEQWERDLDEAILLKPPHLSVYGLTLHEGTEMYRRSSESDLSIPDEEVQRSMFLEARHRLTEQGWRHYEISNYALPGHQGRHNSLYWTGGEYLGLGVAAHSCHGGIRRANPVDLEEWLNAIESGRNPAVADEPPPARIAHAERIMLALRACEGFDPVAMGEEMGCNFLRDYSAELETLEEYGLLSVSREKVALTEEGLLLSDMVFEAFF